MRTVLLLLAALLLATVHPGGMTGPAGNDSRPSAISASHAGDAVSGAGCCTGMASDQSAEAHCPADFGHLPSVTVLAVLSRPGNPRPAGLPEPAQSGAGTPHRPPVPV